MRKLEITDPSRLLSELRKAALHSEDGVVLHRLHCLLLLAVGYDCHRLAEWFGRDPRTMERWVHRYETQGVEGLREGNPGRPGRLDRERLQALRRDLGLSPERLGYGRSAWDGPLLAEHVGRRYGVSLGVRQSQRLLRLLGRRDGQPSGLVPPPKKRPD